MKTETKEKIQVPIMPYKEVVDARHQAIKDRERELNSDGTADHYRTLFNKVVSEAAARGDERAVMKFASEHQDALTLNCLIRLLEGDIKAAGYTLRESTKIGEMQVFLY